MFYIQIIWPDLTSGSGPTIPDSILFLLFLFTLFAFFLFLFPSQTTIEIRILDIVTYQLKIFSRSITEYEVTLYNFEVLDVMVKTGSH